MRRRRFIKIAAAALVSPKLASAETAWGGIALGAEVSILLRGHRADAKDAMDGIRSILRAMEAEFSIFDATSAICRLNRTGALHPSADFRALCVASDRAHRLTDGMFDPTVQSLWLARAAGLDERAGRAAIGWNRIVLGEEIKMEAGQAITFNGIAQGYATDRIKAFVADRGFGPALIDIGEYAALGGPFAIGIEDPSFGLLGRRHLTDAAVATSSPGAMTLGGGSHILGPSGEVPLWSTVSVEADSATLADGLSTALVFMQRDEIFALISRLPEIHSVTLISREGDLSSLTA